MLQCLLACVLCFVRSLVSALFAEVEKTIGRPRGLCFEQCEGRALMSAGCADWHHDIVPDKVLTPSDPAALIGEMNIPTGTVHGVDGVSAPKALDALLVINEINVLGVGAPVCAPSITITGPESGQIVANTPGQHLATLHWDGADPYQITFTRLDVSGAVVDLANHNISYSANVQDVFMVLPDGERVDAYTAFNTSINANGSGFFQQTILAFGDGLAGRPTGDWKFYGTIVPLVPVDGRVKAEFVISSSPWGHGAIFGPMVPIVPVVDPVSADSL